jgi:NTP pyrophosphatase (non-canonical NTP hydrolase)
MNAEEYASGVKRTESFDIDGIRNKLENDRTLLNNKTIPMALMTAWRESRELSTLCDSLKKILFYDAQFINSISNCFAKHKFHNEKKFIEKLSTEKNVRLIHCILGLHSEAGELFDALMHELVYGQKESNDVWLSEEIGDALWYLHIGMRAANKSLEEIMIQNQTKLRKRYPDGFNEGDAINRNIEAESEAMIGLYSGNTKD